MSCGKKMFEANWLDNSLISSGRTSRIVMSNPPLLPLCVQRQASSMRLSPNMSLLYGYLKLDKKSIHFWHIKTHCSLLLPQQGRLNSHLKPK